jgi:hypothetical protein
MTLDPRVRVHQDWLGMLQPTGLFLAPRVLADAGAAPTEPIADIQHTLLDRVVDHQLPHPLHDLAALFAWPDEALRHGDTLPPDTTLHLDGGITLQPDFALLDLDTARPTLLGMVVAPHTALDAAADDPRWTATAHQRLERLLRDRDCPVGLLCNHRLVRVVYAPRGEATAHATWRVADLVTVAGRPLLAALHMCLNARRLLTLDGDQRLPHLLAQSRAYQNTVSTRLQAQVLDALQELLDGLQRADRLTDGRLLAPWRTDDDTRQGIYRGLVTALLRMVFVLFAEERGLLPLDARRYRESYALTSLHAQLQGAHAALGDRLDARYGAWARVVALFRLLHDGIDARSVPEGFFLPPRRGDFFDPDRFAFLEGRAPGPRPEGPLEVPKIADGTVYRVLDKLLVLEGERLKYSDLAVEQIGSVYEGIMGYTLELAEGRCLRVRLDRREAGALDLVVELQRFTQQPRKDFLQHLTDQLGIKLTDATVKALETCKSADGVAAILAQQKALRNTTPIDAGWMYLQPGEERRRSGSHYTPRALTEPIVARTLGPVLDALGAHPTPEAILGLRVCDPAMGSGAFLVEVCRQLAVRLEAAWRHHRATPAIPPDEDPLLHARRRVAQRCLYGVDRNPLAVDLARLSLWLETFARDHAFTFVDHCLRHGDSLVGLSLEQIASVSLDTTRGAQLDLVRATVQGTLQRVRALRGAIHAAGDVDPPDNADQRRLWRDAEAALDRARTVGDLVVAAFFAHKSDRERAKALAAWHGPLTDWLTDQTDGRTVRDAVRDARHTQRLVPFHWPLEFPEVFDHGGFDAFVGNPPFMGGGKISGTLGAAYLDWLKGLHAESHGNADLVAHFFRRAFSYLKEGGTLGMIATNTLAQGDTRATGLRWICTHGGTIYEAQRRYEWPGLANVVVVVVHLMRGEWSELRVLDGREVPEITAFLFHRGGHENPAEMLGNAELYFRGTDVYGKGFTFDDREKRRDTVSSLAEMQALLARDPRNAQRIFPYLGGEEINDDPEQKPHRFVINFGEMTEEEARTWPDLMAIVEAKVKPDRLKQNRETRARYWWRFGEPTPALFRALQSRSRVLANSKVTAHLAFSWMPANVVFSHNVTVFTEERDSFFTVMQSSTHEAWAVFFSSTLGDRLNYMPSDCFETFPFPRGWADDAGLADLGQRYHQHRAQTMRDTLGTKKPEGLTATYNRVHSPHEHSPAIVTLRDLHAQLDRAVLDAYGWGDLRPVYDFRVQLDGRVRWTWGEDTRDEVLARLLEENRVRSAPPPSPPPHIVGQGSATSGGTDGGTGSGTGAKRAGAGRRKKGETEGKGGSGPQGVLGLG